jgi:hypothetical protein
MPTVDNAVIYTLLEHVFVRDRLIDLVGGDLQTANADLQSRRAQLGELKAEALTILRCETIYRRLRLYSALCGQGNRRPVRNTRQWTRARHRLRRSGAPP